MTHKIGTIDILSLMFDLYVTDEDEQLEGISGERCFGWVNVSKCRIMLDIRVALPLMQLTLHHEVEEAIIRLLDAGYADQHDWFESVHIVRRAVVKRNMDWLYGAKLAESVKEVKNALSDRVA